MEIERKFLIQITDIKDLAAWKKIEIFQGFLSFEPIIRLRQWKTKDVDKYFITIKGKGLLAHSETETEITKQNFDELSVDVTTGWIHKYRYQKQYGKYVFELDEFLDDLEGLCVIEVEFKTEDEASAFEVPTWFGLDVTLDRKYKNSELIKKIKERK
jgi:adenylate cyclase